jgi:DNA-binding GntR family transcriptional regulator
MSGWIKLHRQILEWGWYTDVPIKVVFFHIVLKANHKEKIYKGTTVKVGCLLTSRDDLAQETGLKVAQVRRALNKLESTGEIAINTNSQGTHIQIVKYKDYQLTASESANEQPTNSQQTATNKKERSKEREEAASAAAHEMNFTDQKNQVESFRDGTTDRWYEFTSIWITTEDPAILNKNTKKKYWDKLTVEIQESLIKMVKNLGTDMQYLKTVWISECFKNKGMNSIYLKEKIAYQKSKSNSKIDKANKDTTHNFSGQYE